VGVVEPPRHLVVVSDRQQQESFLGAFGRFAVDEALGAAEPAVGAPGLAQGHGAKAHAERRPRRCLRRPFGEPDLVIRSVVFENASLSPESSAAKAIRSRSSTPSGAA
jgi:hypothetical protein